MKKVLPMILVIVLSFALLVPVFADEPTSSPTIPSATVSKGLDITDKTDLVSICYSTWFNPIINNGEIYNIADILAGKAPWGPVGAFHYWGEPALGYYRSDDTDVIRTHMTELSEAGIDFIIIDNTNASLRWKGDNSWNQMISQPITALLNTMMAMRSEGKATPYVVFWNKTDPDTSSQDYDGVTWAMYNEFMASGEYDDLFVYWNGKPFVLTTNNVPPSLNSTFTARKMWGLQSSLETSEWSFLQHYPQNVSYDANGAKEQISVSTAMQHTYMSNPDAVGRRGGYTFWEEWTEAFEVRPKVVTISWWNEWAAQRYEENGNIIFVDNYTEEYSRDIEPMMGGHGDEYYQWMKQYIAAYKNHEECPQLTEDTQPITPTPTATTEEPTVTPSPVPTSTTVTLTPTTTISSNGGGSNPRTNDLGIVPILSIALITTFTMLRRKKICDNK
jgi:hypothetical protein